MPESSDIPPVTCTRCGHSQEIGHGHCLHCGLPLYAKPTGWHPRTWWRWTRWFLLHKILHVDDTPHRIAMGLAVGMFVAITPTFGLQMILVVLTAWLVRANKVVGVPLCWITNPVTMGPIYYFNYWIGTLMVGRGGKTLSDFQALSSDHGGWWASVEYGWRLIWDVFWQCWLGSFLVGGIGAVLTYGAGLWFVRWYRAGHRRRFPGSRFDEAGRVRADAGGTRE